MDTKDYLEDSLLKMREEKLKDKISRDVYLINYDQLEIIRMIMELEEKKKIKKIGLLVKNL